MKKCVISSHHDKFEACSSYRSMHLFCYLRVCTLLGPCVLKLYFAVRGCEDIVQLLTNLQEQFGNKHFSEIAKLQTVDWSPNPY